MTGTGPSPPAQSEGSPNLPVVGSEKAQPSPCPARLSLGSPVLAELAQQCPEEWAGLVRWQPKPGFSCQEGRLSKAQGMLDTAVIPAKDHFGLFQQETLGWAGLSAPQDPTGRAGQVGACWRLILFPGMAPVLYLTFTQQVLPPKGSWLCFGDVLWPPRAWGQSPASRQHHSIPFPWVFLPLSLPKMLHMGVFFAVNFCRIHVWHGCPCTECPSMGSQ